MDNNTNIASAFKWRITNAKYIYITDEGIDNGKYGLPFIYDMSGDTRVYPNGIETSGVPNEGEIKLVASLLGPVEYEEQFTTMLTLMQSDEDGKYLQLLSWDAYYKNLEGCSEGATSVTCKPMDVFFEAVTNSYPCGAQAEVNISNITDETYPDGGVKRTFELTFCFPEGNQGTQGEIGTQGVIGTQGMRGTQGYIGTQGMRGTQGYRGTQGPQGAQGPDGGVYPVGEAPDNVKYNVLGYNSNETPLVSKYSNVYYEAFKENGDDYFTINGQDETTVVYNRVYILSLYIKERLGYTKTLFVYYNNYVREHATELFGNTYNYYEYTRNAYVFKSVQNGAETTIGSATRGQPLTGGFYDYLYDTVRTAMNRDDNTESGYTIMIERFPESILLLDTNQQTIGYVRDPLYAECHIDELAIGKPILQVNEFKNIEVFPEDDGEVVVRTTESGLSENYTEYHQTSNHIEIKTKANSTSTLNITEDEIALTGAQCSVNSNLMVTGTATAKVNNVSDVTLGAPVGSVIMWAGSDPPDGWLLCDGKYIRVNSYDGTIHAYKYNTAGNDSWSTFETLVSVLQENYGRISPGQFDPDKDNFIKVNGTHPTIQSSDDVVAIMLPNFQRRFPLGAQSGTTWSCGTHNFNTELGHNSGEKEVTLTTNEINHYHSLGYNTPNLVNTGDTSYILPYANTYGVSTNEDYKPSAHNNIPPYLALNFIIKYQ